MDEFEQIIKDFANLTPAFMGKIALDVRKAKGRRDLIDVNEDTEEHLKEEEKWGVDAHQDQIETWTKLDDLKPKKKVRKAKLQGEIDKDQAEHTAGDSEADEDEDDVWHNNKRKELDSDSMSIS